MENTAFHGKHDILTFSIGRYGPFSTKKCLPPAQTSSWAFFRPSRGEAGATARSYANFTLCPS